jgi:hypothetical protein
VEEEADAGEDSEDYDEDNSENEGKKKRKAKRGSKKKAASAKKAKKVQTLAQVLLEAHSSRPQHSLSFTDDYISAEAGPSRLPQRHLCAVTGWPAKYREPNSGLFCESVRAFDQLVDQPPPWVRSSGAAPYHEAVRLIKQERASA